MSEQKKSFEVTIRGQYQALGEHSGVPTMRNYEETFILPSQEAALSNICKHLLSPRLKKRHSDFIRYRTHELINIKLIGYTPDTSVLQMGIDDMNLSQLSDFCILRQIMIDPFKHGAKDIFAIRTMVQKEYTDKRLAQKEATTSKEGIAAREADALRKLNDLSPASQDSVININEQKITQDKNKADGVKHLSPSPAPANDGEVLSDEPLGDFVEDADPVLE